MQGFGVVFGFFFFSLGFPASLHGSAKLYSALDFKIMDQTCEIN